MAQRDSEKSVECSPPRSSKGFKYYKSTSHVEGIKGPGGKLMYYKTFNVSGTAGKNGAFRCEFTETKVSDLSEEMEKI